MNNYITTADVAKMYGVTRQSVLNWIKKGMPFEKRINKRYRFDKEKVDKWIEAQN